MARLNAGRIVGIALFLAVTAVAAHFLAQHHVKGDVQARHELSPPGLDLSDTTARSAFLRYLRFAPNVWTSSLLDHCDEGNDTYRVAAFDVGDAFNNSFVEVRLSGASATSLRYEYVDSALPPPPPPAIPPPTVGTSNAADAVLHAD